MSSSQRIGDGEETFPTTISRNGKSNSAVAEQHGETYFPPIPLTKEKWWMTTSEVLKIPDSRSDEPLSRKQIGYLNHRLRNQIYGDFVEAFAHAVVEYGGSRAKTADRLNMHRSQITRMLSAPSNLTLDSISTFLAGIGAELETKVVFFDERPTPNYAPDLVVRLRSKTQTAEPRIVDFGKTEFVVGTTSTIVEASIIS